MNRQPQSYDTLCSPSTTSYNSEGLSETINSLEEDDINELSQKFEQLQRQIEVLTATQTTQDERYKRSRQENDNLLTRVHGLEDQLRELEINSEVRAKEDERRFKETMAKQVKSQSQECEQHLHANFLLQQEIFKLKTDLLKSESAIRALRSEKESIENELLEKQGELLDLDEELHKLKLVVKNLKQEEDVKSNLISILNEELEVSQNRSQLEQQQQQHNQSSNLNSTQHSRKRSSSSRSSVTSGYCGGGGEDFFAANNNNSATNANSNNNNATSKDMDGLEMSLSRLRDENKRLKEMNEELQVELLNSQLEEGRSLIQEGNKSYSLADEMGDIDVTRLMKALKEQQDDNARLKKYIDEILVRIIEKNSEILEMKT